MSRLRARAFSALAALAIVLGAAAPARAQDAALSNFWFAGTRLTFERAVPLDGDVAVSIRDAGLLRLLARLGATISYQPQQRYVVVTASDRRTVTFTLGSADFSAGGVAGRATFAPFVDGTQPIVPLFALAHALYVEPVEGAGETILQPQIGAIDIRTDAGRSTVVIRGATALAYVKRVDTPTHVELAFGGIGSVLGGTRKIGDGITATITAGGPPRNPTTIVAFDAPRGFTYDIAPPASPYELALSVSPAASAAGAAPAAVALATAPPPVPLAPTPRPALATPRPLPALASVAVPAPLPLPLPAAAAPSATPGPGDATPPVPAQPANVTSIVLTPAGDGLTIRVQLDGAATFDWHRLADLRWYVDIHGARLTDAGRDEQPTIAAVESVRIRQVGTPDDPTVRVALTLRGEKAVDVATDATGLTISATNVDAIDVARTGAGRVGSAAIGDDATPPLLADTPPGGLPFGPAVPGSRIIVLDPGHGGDDFGTAHNGLVEKYITIDVARRLRALLVAAGWTVRMTRDSDVDPVSASNLAAMRADGRPNPDDRAYLQTRCDVANSVNARLFISIHVNYSDSPSVNGTTFYWYKPQDQALALALERTVIPVAGTNDVGPRHENFYVIRHTTMPAVLIETAFISNPHDATQLSSPSFLQNMAQGIANGVKAYAGAPAVQASQADQ
jgi:N-acetylmuramoyl-L-alanine amidase